MNILKTNLENVFKRQKFLISVFEKLIKMKKLKIPKDLEGKVLTKHERIAIGIIGLISTPRIVLSIPIDIIGMPINYLLKIENKCLTKESYYISKNLFKASIKGRFPPYDKND